jgi:hypothetical protein
MPCRAFRRVFAVFLPTLLLLAAAASAAAPARRESTRIQPASVVSFLWNALSRLWEKTGGSLDPNGLPRTGQGTENGSSLDPSGAPNQNGSSLDPDGVR